MMTDANMKVLTNIIGAVESGGQVYGKRRYNAYTPPYTNTPNEHTITLGWAQNYGPEAQKLIKLIRDINPANFKNIDPKGVIADMLDKDWVAMRWNPTASQRNILINLIDSAAGHEAQDKLFAELMNKYIADCEKEYTSDIPAEMMYCEIRHLGGKSAVDRIFRRCNGYYTLDNIMASLKKDQYDTSSNNQVGDSKFWSRHQKCVEFINQYAEKEERKAVKAKDVILTAESWVGYLEKKNGNLAYLQSKKENAGDANYTWFGYIMHRLYPKTMDYPAAWCDAFVDFCFYTTYGKEMAEYLLCGEFDDYTVSSAQKYKDKGQWYTEPRVGDQIFFKNSSRICHTGIVYKIENNRVYTIEGNTHEGEDVIPNGGGVCKKSYALYNSNIAGYGRPDYGEAEKYMFEVETVKRGDKNNSVLLMQEIFRARGYKMKNGNIQKCSGKCGEQTEYVIKWYQQQRRLTVDGICGPKTWRDLLAL